MDIDKNNLHVHEFYMREALKEAQEASSIGEVPVGAVVVYDGEIIARAHNMVETKGRSKEHAEMCALELAEDYLDRKWLKGCDLYVTLEPCSMCAGAMVLARIDRLYIGAMDPKHGACGSILNIACNERINHRIKVENGILEEECSRILKDFFREMRSSKLAQRRGNTSEELR